MKAGPGWECQPVEPPGAIVVVMTTVSVGALEKILKLGELSWNGATLIRPSVAVYVTPEGGVAHATPASVNGARNRKPARMMTMRFMCVQSLLVAVSRTAAVSRPADVPPWLGPVNVPCGRRLVLELGLSAARARSGAPLPRQAGRQVLRR